MSFEEILVLEFWGNSVKVYLLSFLFFVALLVAFRIFEKFIVMRLKKVAASTNNGFDDEVVEIFDGIPAFVYYVVALYFPLKYLYTNEVFEKWIKAIFVIVVVYQSIRALQMLINFLITKYAVKQRDKGAEVTVHGLNMVVSIVLWFSGLLLVLSNLGVNINSLIASLGIGGVAVALAIKNILGDLFSSFSIYFDKPFKVGDFIVLSDTHMGTVKRIGLKTTRLETLHGEELVISNTDLTNARVQNYKKMKRRRVLMNIGFVYGTSSAKLKKVNEIVKKVIDKVEGIEFARSHFKDFGAFSLDFEICYYVLSNDYNVYLDKHQEVNFAIKNALEKAKIEIAFPTQTLHLQK